jgi:hypothetical protein
MAHPVLERLGDRELRILLRETVAARKACPDDWRQHAEDLAQLEVALRGEVDRRAAARGRAG